MADDRLNAVSSVYWCMWPLPFPTMNILVPSVEKARSVGDASWDVTENVLPVWVTEAALSRSSSDPASPFVYDMVMVSTGRSILSRKSVTVSSNTSSLVTATGAYVRSPDMVKSEGVMAPFSVTLSESVRVIDLGVVATAEVRVGELLQRCL